MRDPHAGRRRLARDDGLFDRGAGATSERQPDSPRRGILYDTRIAAEIFAEIGDHLQRLPRLAEIQAATQDNIDVASRLAFGDATLGERQQRLVHRRPDRRNAVDQILAIACLKRHV